MVNVVRDMPVFTRLDFSPTEMVLEEVACEREYQDEKWGGEVYDDTHHSHDWFAFIVGYAGKGYSWPIDLANFRKCMVKVAALAVAAVEWADRRLKKE